MRPLTASEGTQCAYSERESARARARARASERESERESERARDRESERERERARAREREREREREIQEHTPTSFFLPFFFPAASATIGLPAKCTSSYIYVNMLEDVFVH